MKRKTKKDLLWEYHMELLYQSTQLRILGSGVAKPVWKDGQTNFVQVGKK